MATAPDALERRKTMIQCPWLQAARQCSNLKMTRATMEQVQTLSGTESILGESRNPLVDSRRTNEARTSARS